MIFGTDIPLYLRLYLTLKSKFPLACSFLGESPERVEAITSADARKYIDAVEKAREITWVDICGGEPFLYYDAMIEVLAYAKGKGIPGKVTTSAFWASEMSKAAWIVKKLNKSGVDRLEIRFDSMYAENVSFECIKNAAIAARQEGFILQVVSSYLDPVSEVWADKGPFTGDTTNEKDSKTQELQQELAAFLPKRCLGWERVRFGDNNESLSAFLGDRYSEARLNSERLLAASDDQNGRIKTAVNVNILPNGDMVINGREMGNAREKDAERMVRDFIIETRMAF